MCEKPASEPYFQQGRCNDACLPFLMGSQQQSNLGFYQSLSKGTNEFESYFQSTSGPKVAATSAVSMDDTRMR